VRNRVAAGNDSGIRPDAFFVTATGAPALRFLTMGRAANATSNPGGCATGRLRPGS
jgi:hypothetical protein